MKAETLPCRDCGLADRAPSAEQCPQCIAEALDAMQANAYLQGRSAALKGSSVDANPFAAMLSLPEWKAWDQGWHDFGSEEPDDILRRRERMAAQARVYRDASALQGKRGPVLLKTAEAFFVGAAEHLWSLYRLEVA